MPLMFKIIVLLGEILLVCSVGACERQVDKNLVSAAADGGTAKVEALLVNGANIEARANDDWTALTIASERGRVDTVRLLLEKGAKVNAKEGGGHTPLFWAEFHHRKEVAELLKSVGGTNE